jgi:uncharacterized protein (TIGR03118 family)
MKTAKQVAIALAMTLAATFVIEAQTPNADTYLQTVLVSNVANGSASVDPNLVDPWGISASNFWVSDHLSGKSTVYSPAGVVSATVAVIPPGSSSAAGSLGRPTGIVNSITTTPPSFVLPSNGKGASFIFATDDGTISAWNGGTAAVIQIDNSALKAVYKGLAIGMSASGPTLYAANFRSGKIDVFNSAWAPMIPAGSFSDPAVPSGFAPFNIWNLNNSLYVTWAKQDANKFLDVGGAGNGYVSVFDLNGNLLTHLISGGALNSPWGVAIAPLAWGAFGGSLLVGNFGDGRINAFNLTTGAQLGTLQDVNGNPITISGLWALVFGVGGARGGDAKTLYFTAGVPNGTSVSRGQFGSLAPPAAIQTIVNAASQMSLPLAPGRDCGDHRSDGGTFAFGGGDDSAGQSGSRYHVGGRQCDGQRNRRADPLHQRVADQRPDTLRNRRREYGQRSTEDRRARRPLLSRCRCSRFRRGFSPSISAGRVRRWRSMRMAA